MMMRVYRCTVVEGKEAELKEYGLKKSHPWLKSRPGFIAFYAGKSLPGSGARERCMVQIWESLDAIKAAMGENWDQPLVLSEEVRTLIECASVEHYELVDTYRIDETAARP